MKNDLNCDIMEAANPVMTDASVLKEETEMSGAKGNKITALYCRLSRMGRNSSLLGLYTNFTFPQHGVRYIAINDNYDTADLNSVNNDMAGIKNWFNEFYARDTSRKIRAVQKSKGEQGIPLTTNIPYGYRKDPENPKHWVIDPEAAEVVKRIFDMCMQGRGPSKIAKQLVEGRNAIQGLRKQLDLDEKRISELKRLFIKIYEDNAGGKLSDERFYLLSQSYETEQKKLEAEVISLQNKIEQQEKHTEGIEKFIRTANQHVGIEKLDVYVLHELILGIYVDAPDKSSGKRKQHIHIKYDGVGFIPLSMLRNEETA